MGRRRVLATVAVLAACVLAGLAVASVARHRSSRGQLAAAVRGLDETRRTVTEVLALRGSAARVAPAAKPPDDLIARVNAILAELRMPSARHFGGLREERAAARAGSDARYRRQTVRISLVDLAPREVGAFLAAWQEAEPLWSPARIELVHRPGSRQEENRYDVSLVISALHLVES